MPTCTVIERGPKDKRSVAFALDWPGWSRGAKTAELAVETLESYRERYRPIAGLAGLARDFDAAGPLEVVEERVGTGSVDFLGHLLLGLFDRARADGRGGTRASDHAVAVSLGVFRRRRRAGICRRCARARKAGRVEDPGGSGAHLGWTAGHRVTYLAAMRAYNTGEIEKRMRPWTLPFLIRHSAFHTLDPAWEMKDKDLSAEDLGLGRCGSCPT